MTTIVAARNEDGTVDIAWDSQTTAGNRLGHTDKLVTLNEQMHIGLAGYARFADIIQYANLDSVHKADFESEEFDAREYLVSCAVPTWIKAVRDAEHIHRDKEDWADGGALIVLKGRIFKLGHDFSVVEFLTHGGIGSGSDYARGALANGATVQRALEIAAELDPYTGGVLNEMVGV